jgi:CHAT domain-containing protein
VSPAAGNEIRLKQSLTRLYDLLIRPVEPGVENSAQLCIIPDGNLFYLPFHGLIRRSVGGRQQYTLEKWAISYLTSAEFIDITRAPQTNTSQRVVAFADADGTLPNSAQEVRAIRAFRPDAVIYTGKEATETRAIQEAANSSVLIFSNHCLLNSQNPNQTFIQLYPSATADGRLHLPEVQNLRCSRLNLAVLTACQTAMGEQAPGREVHNMARSFSIAGASAIIASLWSISDLATYDLMVIFYEQLLSKKQSKIEALRQAQLTMLQRQEYRHPFYWAAFELIGDWR